MNIEVYTRSSPYCTYCARAKQDLMFFKQEYTEYDVATDEHAFADLKIKYPQARTFPVVIVDGQYIGGRMELRRFLNEANGPKDDIVTSLNGLKL